ncbi:SPOR domain-containing protein [Oceanospirillum sediminis]|uniref:SPOR domain-containing protein n=1 Tax=Oceanospirillum sediminis TaxID=2760088 RepID=A0A839IQQ3_9GAMM|nr:SPOR domain-containing protein [Oceanospirillum sediminis]
MKYGLKHRIIGAVILISVAVIFLPVLLDGGQRPQLVQTTTPIPAPPPDAEIKVEQPADPGRTPSIETGEPERENWQSGLTDQKKLAAWTLQAASFKTEDNAAGMRDKLRKSDIRSYIRQRKDYFVVYAGPFADSDAANEVKARLKKEFSVSALMVRYDPMADVRN